ncbi:zinc finger CCCH domain-containing protein 15 [Trypanosoma equiperdum]|uniref:Zinc finger CCCH domain-containing protein 15 n=1 Tax=Trypanosoma equiperdum TaxID=5694 RepID=A0A1G4I4B8_TRYEQ|nr:zinc finger CCCH domain-containing protein 15 [Trypanosoma equiperdum]
MRPEQCDTYTELSSAPRETKVICKYFATGGCSRGAACAFSHVLNQNAPEGVDASRGFFICGNVANFGRTTALPTTQSVLSSPPSTTPEDSSILVEQMCAGAQQLHAPTAEPKLTPTIPSLPTIVDAGTARATYSSIPPERSLICCEESWMPQQRPLVPLNHSPVVHFVAPPPAMAFYHPMPYVLVGQVPLGYSLQGSTVNITRAN